MAMAQDVSTNTPAEATPSRRSDRDDLLSLPLGKERDESKEALMPSATITSKGQITLPKAIRDLLRLGAGDRVDFIVKDDGTVVLSPATVDVRELKGVLHRKGLTPLSIAEMNAIIRRRGAGRA